MTTIKAEVNALREQLSQIEMMLIEYELSPQDFKIYHPERMALFGKLWDLMHAHFKEYEAGKW